MFDSHTFAWIGFNLFVVAMVVLDLSIFHKRPHVIQFKEAIGWSLFWIALALGFNAIIYFTEGLEPALNFFAGYLIEKSLSIDNLFVFLLIFKYFHVPAIYTHRVLFWGIIGALICRAIFIAGGIYLVQQFHWILYLFGAFLIFTGIKLALHKDQEIHPEKNIVIRLFRRFMSVTRDYENGHFFVRKHSKWVATPLFIVLLMIETTDVIFAMDSIPAVMAITLDPFIIYTSNVFAILGLRSIYFALHGMMGLFHHLHYGLSATLIFIGSKMLIADFYKVPVAITLGVIGTLLAVSVIASILDPKKEKI